VYNFTQDQPLIGIYGNSGTSFINALSFITLDTVSNCQNYFGEEIVEEEVVEEEVVEEEVVEEEVVEEEANSEEETVTEEETIEDLVVEEEGNGGVGVETIAMFVGGVVVAILLLLCIVMACEKCRKKNKRITEIVQLTPVDIESHRKGIVDRASKVA
jgi:hypothetical protein